jgi:hypothetical protein
MVGKFGLVAFSTVAGCCEHGNEISVSIKVGEKNLD